ncbi:MAG: DUF1566 domain-containing protein [Nitrospinae bacterium]|nr:DUF1566 domain-containing protein [Nitrospinota bacterium]MBL7019169.1 DUF1566 domain-containing protein [Nitrospinaceae bacterium]
MSDTPPSSEATALSPAEKAKLAAAKKAEAAKKAGPVGEPLVDNDDGTITDPNTSYMWKKTDAWLDMKKFYTWADHSQYVDWVNENKDKFGGYDNWRIPTKAEAVTLFDKTGVKSLVDKNGTSYPIDSIFAPGGASNTWISECSDEKIIRMDLKIGVDTDYPTADVWSSMRLIRKEGEAPPAKAGAPAPEVTAASEQPAEAPAGAAQAAPATAAPKASGGTPKPIPRKDFSSEERAAMLKRARAHAAEVKARKG